MISIILAAGSLSDSMSSLVSTDSVLRLPLGGKTAFSEVLKIESTQSEMVFVAHAGQAPDFYAFLSPTIIWIDIGSPRKTIGHSVLACIEKIWDYLRGELPSGSLPELSARIIFADTITTLQGLDVVAVGQAKTSEDWTFAPMNFSDEAIQGRASVASQRVIVGAFSFSQFGSFSDILAANVHSHDSLLRADPFFEAIREYSQSLDRGLEAFEDADWHDTGHREGYFNFRQSRLEGREFNDFVVGPGGLFVSKSSSNSEKLWNESHWFRNVPPGLSQFLPRVIVGGEDHYEVQYVRALTLAEKVLYGEQRLLDLTFATNRLDSWFSVTSPPVLSKLGIRKAQDFSTQFLGWFQNNTNSRLDHLDANAALLGRNIQKVTQKTAEARKILRGLCFKDFSPAIVHGDLILSNILVDERDGVFKLIDPRGGFGEASIYGLQIYDWAKLAQSIFGRYEEIIAGEYEILGIDESVSFSRDPDRLSNYRSLSSWFDKSCPAPDLAKQLAGLLLISAIPFHVEDQTRTRAMFRMGSQLADL